MSQPNVILALSDDQGLEQFSIVGPGLAPDQQPSMPVIGRLAQQGVLFTRAHVQPICSPTRAEIETGSYGFRTGIETLAEYTAQPLLDGEVCLPRALKLATGGAYACAHIGKWHLSDYQTVGGDAAAPCRVGYDYFSGPLRNLDGADNYYNWLETTAQVGASGGIRVTQKAVNEYAPMRQLETALSWISRQTTPWLLRYSFSLPHAPYMRPPPDLYNTSRWVLPDLTAPGVDSSARPYYKAMEEAADTLFGRLLAGIPSSVLANTLIFVQPDNGTPNEVVDQAYIDAGLSGHFKRSVFSYGIQTPLIVAGAGVSGPGRTSDAIVKSVDFMATIVDACGGDMGLVPANPAHARDSVSFMPVVRGQSAVARAYAWADVCGTNVPHTSCSIVGTRTLRYARYQIVKSNTTGVSFPSGTGGAVDATVALYDNQVDPNQLVNLVAAGSPFVSAGIINLVDGDGTHPGILSAYSAAVAQYATLTATL